MSYLGQSLGVSYPSVEMESVYSTAPADWADELNSTTILLLQIGEDTLKTCQKRWMIGRNGERGPGMSVLVARHDDDDEGWYAFKQRNWIEPICFLRLFFFSSTWSVILQKLKSKSTQIFIHSLEIRYWFMPFWRALAQNEN